MVGRRKTRRIWVGKVPVGGDAPISVQTMTKTDTRDVAATVAQIKELEELGCDIVRLAVPDAAAARALSLIKREVSVPLVADIHFDYRLALLALEAGADGIRINPGNIGGPERLSSVIAAARERGVPIRIGVNSGSLEKEVVQRYGRTAEGLVESALRYVGLFEDAGYTNIKISVKAPSVPVTIAAYRMLAERLDYPLHIGITEAGGPWAGTIKSAVGLGALLAEGIGDTIRVSLTAPPQEEVKVGIQILRSLGLRPEGIELVSCPTCGRCEVDLMRIAREVERQLPQTRRRLQVAVMGCSVNGPGEAKEADVGIAGGKGFGLLFKKGKFLRRVPEERLVAELIAEVKEMLQEG